MRKLKEEFGQYNFRVFRHFRLFPNQRECVAEKCRKCRDNAETQGRIWTIQFPRIPPFTFISESKKVRCGKMQKMRKQCGNTRKNMDEIISAYSAISVCFRI